LALAVTVWARLVPLSSSFAAVTVTQMAGLAEDAGRWLLVEEFHRLLRSLQDDHEKRERLRVTAWLAKERRLGAQAIVDEVEGWDVRALPQVFDLAKLILLHRDDEANAMTQELLATGDLAAAEVEQWLLCAVSSRRRASALSGCQAIPAVIGAAAIGDPALALTIGPDGHLVRGA
jgi:hypothetical protein